jgi:hypothetical protein
MEQKMEKAFIDQVASWLGLRNKQVVYLAILLGVAIVGAGGFGIYKYFSIQKAKEAHSAFQDSLIEFNKMLQVDPKNQKWEQVVKIFDTAYQRYGSSVMGPYLLAYKAEALVYDNKLEDAIKIMSNSVNSLKQKSPLYYVYAIKLALMKTDSKDSKAKAEGEKELETLANDTKNFQRDEAIYYAGINAIANKNIAKAREFFSKFPAGGKESVWAKDAKVKLASLS